MAMNNKAVTLIVLANLAALVLLAIFLPHLMISPGKLIDAHAELATDCFACHSPFVGSTPRKCIECHKVAEIGITTTKGLPIGKEKKNVAFHQKLLAEDCVACHSDHKGVKAFRPISQFSHRLLQPQVQKQCDGCHSMPGDALHQKLKGNCGTCHTQERWKPATFDHERYFRFDKHHTTDCQTCHVSSDYGSYTCYGCHEHSRSKIREEHVEEGIVDYENCVECHRSSDEEEAKQRMRSRGGGSRDSRPGVYRSESKKGRQGKEDDD
jgi:hypothetical protein